MLKKIISRVLLVLIITSGIYTTTNALDLVDTDDLFSIDQGEFNSGVDTSATGLDTNTSGSDEMSCEQSVLPNSTTIDSKVFDCDMKIGVNFDAMNGASIEVTGNLQVDSNANIEGDLIVGGDLEIQDNLSVGGNLIVTGNITGENSNIDVAGYTKGANIEIGENLSTQAIVSTGYVSLGDNSTIERGVVTDGYLMTGDNFDLHGISLIRGEFRTGNNFDGDGTLYIYGDLKGENNFSFDGTKIKVTNDFTIDDNGDTDGRIFIYGKKTKGVNYNEQRNNYEYLIGEVDPLLQYKLSKSEFNTIKNTTIKADKRVYYYKQSATEMNDYIQLLYDQNTDNRNSQIIQEKISELNGLKQSTLGEYKRLFEYLDKYIENEIFDINKYNDLKERRLNDLNTFLNSMYGNNNSIEIEKVYKKNTKIIVPVEEEKTEEENLENIDEESNVEQGNNTETKTEETVKEEKSSDLTTSFIKKLDSVLEKIEDKNVESTYKRIIKNIDKMLEKEDEDLSIERQTLEFIKKYLENDQKEREIINKIFG